jgi:CheY-like chemotaxis protein
METFDRFNMALRDLLANLHDPLYDIPEVIRAGLDFGPKPPARQIRQAVIDGIHSMQPSDVPPDTPARRYYDLLVLRYLQGLTQEAAADQLGITPRYLRDLQWRAVQALAIRIWKSPEASASSHESNSLGEPSSPSSSQIMEELHALHRGAPGVVADLSDTVQSAALLVKKLWPTRDVIIAEDISPQLKVSLHPSALRQILIKALEALIGLMSSGMVTIEAQEIENRVQVTLLAEPVDEGAGLPLPQMREMLALQGGILHAHVVRSCATIQIMLPAVVHHEQAVVLVVDDNEDLVTFFRSYVTGTPYEIVHTGRASQVWHAIAEHQPDVIVLDIMLPDADVDGWDLLIQLHAHPETHSIPVIVCSVIRDADLAIALGASSYLPKPVRRRQFIEALNSALNRAS